MNVGFIMLLSLAIVLGTVITILICRYAPGCPVHRRRQERLAAEAQMRAFLFQQPRVIVGQPMLVQQAPMEGYGSMGYAPLLANEGGVDYSLAYRSYPAQQYLHQPPQRQQQRQPAPYGTVADMPKGSDL